MSETQQRPDGRGPRPEQVEDYFASNMRGRREALRLSQEEVARRMLEAGFRWRQTTVYKVEQRQRGVSMVEASGLAEVLETTVGRLTLPPALDRVAGELQSVVERINSLWMQVGNSALELNKSQDALHSLLERHEIRDAPAMKSLLAAARRVVEYTPLSALEAYIDFDDAMKAYDSEQAQLRTLEMRRNLGEPGETP